MDRIPLPPAGEKHIEITFAQDGGLVDRAHLLEPPEIHAVNAANAAGRPLLVRGEPGTGKSQLARAAAKALGRALVSYVVDSHSESRDLMWSFDAVRRLADAQIAGTARGGAKARTDLAVDHYVQPGPLWWAFDWESAEQRSERVGSAAPPQPDGGDWRRGTVFLLDEIDKAEPELPNGLLEALGARQFTPFGADGPVRAKGTPLVIITTNEERALPEAFLRRCLVHRLTLPGDAADLEAFLVGRGHAHFTRANPLVLKTAAEMVRKDRERAIAARLRPRPGQAEYLDLVRAVLRLEPDSVDAQLAMLDAVGRYTLGKYVSGGEAD